MTVFDLESLLLLFLAFALGVVIGLLVRRSHPPSAQSRAASKARPPKSGQVPAPSGQTGNEKGSAVASAAAVSSPAAPPDAEGHHSGQTEQPQSASTAPKADLVATAKPEADDGKGADTPRPTAAPDADLFSRFVGTLPDAAQFLDEEDEPPARKPPPSPGGHHPGARPPALEAPEGGKGDDLKLLKGVGPQNEKRLHALGIFHFRQIAAWSPEEVAWVGSYLAFPGRIEREDWIGQARALAERASGDGSAAARKPDEGDAKA